VDKREFIGGLFRGALTGGSWVRLVTWTKHQDTRSLNVFLCYPGGQAAWMLSLKDGSTTVFEGTNETLEAVTIQAVAALGKSV